MLLRGSIILTETWIENAALKQGYKPIEKVYTIAAPHAVSSRTL
jgi:hypothetical protein